MIESKHCDGSNESPQCFYWLVADFQANRKMGNFLDYFTNCTSRFNLYISCYSLSSMIMDKPHSSADLKSFLVNVDE